MLDNSTPFAKETAQLRAVAVARYLKPAERTAALVAGLRLASRTEAFVLSQELVGVIEQRPIIASRESIWRTGVQHLRRLAACHSPDLNAERAASVLVERWSDLPAEVRGAAIARGRGVLMRCVGGAVGREGRSKVGAARLIGDLADPALALHLSPLLLEPRAARAAEESLIALAGAVSGEEVGEWMESEWELAPARVGDHPPAPTPEGRRELHARVAALAMQYAGHRGQGVLRAAMVLLDPGALALRESPARDPLVRWFAAVEHESHMALRAVLKRSPGALARQRAWEWLGRNVTDTASMERLCRAGTAQEHEATLQRGHLRLNPARARRMAQMRVSAKAIRTGGTMLPAARQVASLSIEARRALPAVAATLSVAPDLLREVLRPLAADADPGVRFAVLCAAPEAVGPLLCLDADECVARLAALRMVCGGLGREKDREAAGELLAHVEKSPHASVRQIGRAAREAEGNRVDTLDKLDHGCGRSRLHARRLLAEDRAGFVRELRDCIDSGDAVERTSAVMMARRLSLVGEVELELLRIMAAVPGSAEQERLAATAVAALGELGTPAAAAAVHACTVHSAGRIRANAVEAIFKARGPWGWSEQRRIALELKHDSCHRVRANVLRELLLAPNARRGPAYPAAADLSFMLADTRPLHRLAGLWVLERGIIAGSQALRQRWNTLASRLAELTRGEPEAPVRVRAARCARLMLSPLNNDWPRNMGEQEWTRARDAEAAA